MSWIIPFLCLILAYFFVYYLIPKTSFRISESRRETEISESISKKIDISTTQKFRDLIKNEFSESGKVIRSDYQNDRHYINHCWACFAVIDSYFCYRCPICGWYKCRFCGTCGRGCSARGVYTEHIFVRISLCSDQCLEQIRQLVVESDILNKPLSVFDRLLQLKRHYLPYKEIEQLLDKDGYGEQKPEKELAIADKKDKETEKNENKATCADVIPGVVLYHRTYGKCTITEVNKTSFSAEFSDEIIKRFMFNNSVESYFCKEEIIAVAKNAVPKVSDSDWCPTLCVGDELWHNLFGLGKLSEITSSKIKVDYYYKLYSGTYSKSQLIYSFPDLRTNMNCPNGNKKIFDEPLLKQVSNVELTR